jgi:hypothetical protein
VEEADQVGHEPALRTVLGGVRGVVAAAIEKAVVHLEPPDPALDPLGQLAAASERFVHERRVDVHDGALVAEPDLRGAADHLLPERPGARGVRVGLQGERRLEADGVETVAERLPEAGGGPEDLHRVEAADRKAVRRVALGVDRGDLHAVDLPGEAAPDELLDLQTDRRPGRRRHARHVEREYLPGLVPGDLEGAADPLLLEGRNEMWNGLIRHSELPGEERSRRSRHRASGDHITTIPHGQVARLLTDRPVLRHGSL